MAKLKTMGENEGHFRSKFGVNTDEFQSKFGVNTLKTLLLIHDKPEVTAKDISEKLNITKRTVENCIAKLKTANILSRIGSDKTGYWEVTK